GKNLWNFKDDNGKLINQSFLIPLKLDNNKKILTSYYWKGTREKARKYLMYAQMFKPLDIVIGTGIGIKKINEIEQQKALGFITRINKVLTDKISICDYENNKPLITLNKQIDEDSTIKKSIEIARNMKNKGGFFEWKTEDVEVEEKSSYITFSIGFEQWRWAISLTSSTKELETYQKNLTQELNEKIDDTIIKNIIIALILIIIIGIIVNFVAESFINKPLHQFQIGLQSFFNYLKDPNKKVQKIDIDTHDEFGEMSKSVNKSIKVSMKMHSEMAHLMQVLDKNVITSETDHNGIIKYVSQAFCEISGYSKEELIGKNHNIIRHPDMPDEIFIHMWHTLKNNKVWEGEIKNIKKNGGFFWLNTIISPKCIENQDGSKECRYTAVRYDITDKKVVEDLTINLEIKIEERTRDLHKAKKKIEAILKHTRDSIDYASLIQNALLPNEKLMSNYFKDYFVHWMPKDTVGGDIWLFNELRHEDECLLFFIDCTGHGVPGAFVTMIVKAIEREVVTKIIEDKNREVSPAWIMEYFNKTMKVLLKQVTKDSKSNAGWDGGIIYYNKKDKIIKFAGAETPLFYIDENSEFKTVKGDRYSVGYKKCSMDYKYKETIIPTKEGMKFYCTTDGYLDQNGGEKDFPFGKKRFGNIIKEYHSKNMDSQKEIFINEMTQYEEMIKNNDRNDDMTVIAFEIDKD
ncbi:MAG: PAS domain S-box protein, partial [Campylobacterota bacterium]|nr:PAS domain S-box protein [Campylobacterota bacterium]